MSEQAHRVQNTNGVKSNRNVPKENYVGRHKKSNVSHIDERSAKIEIRLIHPRKSVFTKTIELYSLEREKLKWEREGFEVCITN